MYIHVHVHTTLYSRVYMYIFFSTEWTCLDQLGSIVSQTWTHGGMWHTHFVFCRGSWAACVYTGMCAMYIVRMLYMYVCMYVRMYVCTYIPALSLGPPPVYHTVQWYCVDRDCYDVYIPHTLGNSVLTSSFKAQNVSKLNIAPNISLFPSLSFSSSSSSGTHNHSTDRLGIHVYLYICTAELESCPQIVMLTILLLSAAIDQPIHIN